jgi:hypothetical protein
MFNDIERRRADAAPHDTLVPISKNAAGHPAESAKPAARMEREFRSQSGAAVQEDTAHGERLASCCAKGVERTGKPVDRAAVEARLLGSGSARDAAKEAEQCGGDCRPGLVSAAGTRGCATA